MASCLALLSLLGSQTKYDMSGERWPSAIRSWRNPEAKAAAAVGGTSNRMLGCRSWTSTEQEEDTRVLQEKEKAEDKREEEGSQEEGDMCCGCSETEEGESGAEEGGKACREDECTKEEEAECLAQTEAGKSGTEEGGKACQEDECTKEEEAQCLAHKEGKSATREVFAPVARNRPKGGPVVILALRMKESFSHI
ncbi:hypothetical protein GWK47_025305 [Chionoecetes opilio]|uniref:Uncharacterized protein n=1 Tax=Chionoecetes opilio TaxID=41210 RepID=A0A8J4XP93_CHIOP|nr:hypothetical protein GWK47_025305 [Chionoecetes opilio]